MANYDEIWFREFGVNVALGLGVADECCRFGKVPFAFVPSIGIRYPRQENEQMEVWRKPTSIPPMQTIRGTAPPQTDVAFQYTVVAGPFFLPGGPVVLPLQAER